MSQLQLYIAMSKKGTYQRKLDVNTDEYVSSWICDLHQTVCQVDYSLAEKSIFYLVKYIDSGVFVTVIRTIPGQAGDHLACWIYMPYGLKIDNKQFAETVKFIAEKAALSDIKAADIAEMRNRFATDYDTALVPTIFAPSSGLTTAYRYYGERYGCDIDALIGKYLFQPSYIPYASVLLVNCRITGDIAGRDLSSAPLDEMSILSNPAPNADGYEPFIYEQPFDQPFFAPANRNIDIVWRKGESEIIQPVSVASSNAKCPTLTIAKEPPAQEPQTPDAPTATESAATPAPAGMEAPAADLTKQETPAETYAEMEYQSWNAPSSNAQASDLPQRKNTYFFKIPVKKVSMGSVIEFELTTQSELTESPIEGYEPTGEIREGAAHCNHLIYTAGSTSKKLISNIIWGLAGLIIGALVAALICRPGYSGKTDEVLADTLDIQQAVITDIDGTQVNTPAQQTSSADSQQPNAAAQQQTPADVSLEAAINYLDSNRAWSKTSMEQFPDLKGLYDDMNTFNRERIVSVWKDKLKESRNFKNIANHTEMSLKAHKKPRIPGNRATYNPPSDQSINIQGYLNAVDP